MAIIPPHIVDDIMQASRIEEVIGEFVQLKRAGSNLKGLSLRKITLRVTLSILTKERKLDSRTF